MQNEQKMPRRRESRGLHHTHSLGKNYLTELMSSLQPIIDLNRIAQSEKANQVEVTVALYLLRLQTLNLSCVLRPYNSVGPPTHHRNLTALIKTTRKILREQFDTRYFSRFTNAKQMKSSSFMFEIQYLLHPVWKGSGTTKIAVVCNRDAHEGHATKKTLWSRLRV